MKTGGRALEPEEKSLKVTITDELGDSSLYLEGERVFSPIRINLIFRILQIQTCPENEEMGTLPSILR